MTDNILFAGYENNGADHDAMMREMLRYAKKKTSYKTNTFPYCKFINIIQDFKPSVALVVL